jgi:hypothetical protein
MVLLLALTEVLFFVFGKDLLALNLLPLFVDLTTFWAPNVFFLGAPLELLSPLGFCSSAFLMAALCFLLRWRLGAALEDFFDSGLDGIFHNKSGF